MSHHLWQNDPIADAVRAFRRTTDRIFQRVGQAHSAVCKRRSRQSCRERHTASSRKIFRFFNHAFQISTNESNRFLGVDIAKRVVAFIRQRVARLLVERIEVGYQVGFNGVGQCIDPALRRYLLGTRE